MTKYQFEKNRNNEFLKKTKYNTMTKYQFEKNRKCTFKSLQYYNFS